MFSLQLNSLLKNIEKFRGYFAYSILLKVHGLLIMLCTLGIYGVSGFGELQLLFGLSAFFNSLATFGSPSIAAGKVTSIENSLMNIEVRVTLVLLLRFSSLNYLIITSLWLVARSHIPYFENLSTLDTRTILAVLLYGFIFQVNLILLNVLNALDMSSQMIGITVLRIVGTLLSGSSATYFGYEFTFFMLSFFLIEIVVFLYQLLRVEVLKWLSRIGPSHTKVRLGGYLQWVVDIRYQAVAGILVAFSSLLMQNLLTVNQSSYENGLYNIVLRLAAVFVIPLSVVNLTILSRRNELISSQGSRFMLKVYTRNSALYVSCIFILGLIGLALTGNLTHWAMILTGCIFMLSTALNSYSSNILITTQRIREWAFSDIYLGLACLALTLFINEALELSTTNCLQIMSFAMLVSYSFVAHSLKRVL